MRDQSWQGEGVIYVPMRISIRAEMYALAEDIVIAAHQVRDAGLLALAERNLALVERQYAGIERCLDELNYAAPTRQTLRWERAVELSAD
jgi:hypothetical protein